MNSGDGGVESGDKQIARVATPLWKRFWILFTAIWVLVALLNALTTLAFVDEIPPDRLLTLLAVAVGVPAALYAIGWLRD